MSSPLCIYVDVDDTLVRTVGSTRIPIPSVIRHVGELHREGAILYCWSAGGAEEFGIARFFTAFLPKPNVIIDDQEVIAWPQFLHVHPASISSMSEYQAGA